MGKIKNNVVTKGFSGKFGDDLVFRQVDKKTVFSRRSLVTSAPTQRQMEIRNRFAEASLYASAATDNPVSSEEYSLMAQAQGLKSAYLAALTDYLTLPEIGSIYAAAYTGKVGDLINIKPKVPYKVVEIVVTIQRADGTVLESGLAVANGLRWRYPVTVLNPQVKGSKVILVARDRRGLESTTTVVL